MGSLRATVLDAVEQSHNAPSIASLMEQTGFSRRPVERWIRDLVKTDEIFVVREDPESRKRFYRPQGYQYMNKWLEGWGDAPELGITKWLKDKQTIFNMKSQRDYADDELDDGAEFALSLGLMNYE